MGREMLQVPMWPERICADAPRPPPREGVRCHQRTIRESAGRVAMPMRKLPALVIGSVRNGMTFGRVTPVDGRAFIQKYEWLGHAGRALIFYGMWRDSQLYGVEAFCPLPYGAAKALGAVGFEALYLARGACSLDAGPHAATMLLGACLRDLRRRGVPLVLAYADAAAGETGVIYRAANGRPGGVTTTSATYYFVSGEWRSHHDIYRGLGMKISELPKDIPRRSDDRPKRRFYWDLRGDFVSPWGDAESA